MGACESTGLELTLRRGHEAAGLPGTHAGDRTGHLACDEHVVDGFGMKAGDYWGVKRRRRNQWRVETEVRTECVWPKVLLLPGKFGACAGLLHNVIAT